MKLSHVASKSSQGFTGAAAPMLGRALLAAALLGGLLLGCPLYDEDCSEGDGCARGFACDRFSNRCVATVPPPACLRPEECAAAETCTPDFVCRPGSCDFHGCVGGFTCGVVDGAHACVAPVGDAGTDAGFSLADAAAAISPSDAGDASATPPPVLGDAGDASADASF
jgi:hypothetical protein